MDPVWFAIGIACGIAIGIGIGDGDIKKKLKNLLIREEIKIELKDGTTLNPDEFMTLLNMKKK